MLFRSYTQLVVEGVMPNFSSAFLNFASQGICMNLKADTHVFQDFKSFQDFKDAKGASLMLNLSPSHKQSGTCVTSAQNLAENIWK